MTVNIFWSGINVIKQQRGPPGNGYKRDAKLKYDMQNKRLVNVATSVEKCDVVTRGEVTILKNEADDTHEEVFQNLIVIKSTSERHNEQLKQIEDKRISIRTKCWLICIITLTKRSIKRNTRKH